MYLPLSSLLPLPPAPPSLPHPQIRNAFARLLLYMCQECNKDPPYTLERSFLTDKEAASSFTEVILSRLLELLKREVPQHGRHLQQYFSFFMAFACRTKLEVHRQMDQLHPGLWPSLVADTSVHTHYISSYVNHAYTVACDKYHAHARTHTHTHTHTRTHSCSPSPSTHSVSSC